MASKSQLPIAALNHLPQELREELLSAFDEIVKNYREGRWQPSELNGGHLCEVVYSIIDGYGRGQFPARASKPSNFVDACRDLGKLPLTERSLRITIPRMLPGLYEIRNNRGVGHVGGDVDPNHMDATYTLNTAKWILAELIRVFHGMPIVEAQEVVEALTDREVPIIWDINGKKRILKPGVALKDKVFLLVYQSPLPLTLDQLADHLEHARKDNLRRALRDLHAKKLIEFDEKTGLVHLSPTGQRYVESELKALLWPSE